MVIEQHDCLGEAGTKELIRLTKRELAKKLNTDDADITDGTITIKGVSITPISNITDIGANDILSMWNGS